MKKKLVAIALGLLMLLAIAVPQMDVWADEEQKSVDIMFLHDTHSHLKEFGSEENKAELEKNLSKLILCVEMDNWEKAETFMVAVKQLTDTAPQEIRTCALRLKMAVQKADYEKTSTAYEGLIKLL